MAIPEDSSDVFNRFFDWTQTPLYRDRGVSMLKHSALVACVFGS